MSTELINSFRVPSPSHNEDVPPRSSLTWCSSPTMAPTSDASPLSRNIDSATDPSNPDKPIPITLMACSKRVTRSSCVGLALENSDKPPLSLPIGNSAESSANKTALLSGDDSTIVLALTASFRSFPGVTFILEDSFAN